jgi:hypothetical protein
MFIVNHIARPDVRRGMRGLFAAAAIACALQAGAAHAKGEQVRLWMEGQVSDVRSDGRTIRLVLSGRFAFEQYRGGERSLVEVKDWRGGPASIAAVLTQGRPFYAMTEDWGAGALRKSGALLAILQAAAGTDRTIRLELASARLNFASGGALAVESAIVRRASDASLR